MSPLSNRVKSDVTKSYNFFMNKVIKRIRRAHPPFIWCPGPTNALGTPLMDKDFVREPHCYMSLTNLNPNLFR